MYKLSFPEAIIVPKSVPDFGEIGTPEATVSPGVVPDFGDFPGIDLDPDHLETTVFRGTVPDFGEIMIPIL